MRSRSFFALVIALVALFATAAPASADTGLNAYKAKARGAAELRELKRQGFDITEGQRRGGIEIVATKRQIAKLRRAGISTKLLRDRRGRTGRRAAAAQAAGGWTVLAPVRADRRRDVERCREPDRQPHDAAGEAGQPSFRHREA